MMIKIDVVDRLGVFAERDGIWTTDSPSTSQTHAERAAPKKSKKDLKLQVPARFTCRPKI